MGLPLSSKIAVLYANNALMGIQPQSLEELRQFVENGHSLALWQNAYYMYGFFPAFGAEILEDVYKRQLKNNSSTRRVKRPLAR